MSMITLRFKGMCCFVDGRAGDPFAKRVVLPRDQQYMTYHDEPHKAYVEFEADDVPGDIRLPVVKTATRGEGEFKRVYTRIELDGHRVSIRNAAHGQLIVVPTFEERVAKMTLVCPECPPNPRQECFSPAPPPDLIAGYFDIHGGYLNAGPLELQETAFDEGSLWPSRRLAQWGQLDLEIHGDRPEIVIEKFDGAETRVISLSRGATLVTIGNGREEDIEERSNGSHRREHFTMYYDLAVPQPKNKPRPTPPQSAIRSCSPTSWP